VTISVGAEVPPSVKMGGRFEGWLQDVSEAVQSYRMSLIATGPHDTSMHLKLAQFYNDRRVSGGGQVPCKRHQYLFKRQSVLPQPVVALSWFCLHFFGQT